MLFYLNSLFISLLYYSFPLSVCIFCGFLYLKIVSIARDASSPLLFFIGIAQAYLLKQSIILLPNSIRACIIGKSGCRKTNLLMNLLLQDYLDYNNLYIFSTTLYQPLYQILISGLTNGLVKKKFLNQKFTIGKKDKENSSIQVHRFDDYDCVPDSKEIDPNLKTLIIFDDIMLEKQNKKNKYIHINVLKTYKIIYQLFFKSQYFYISINIASNACKTHIYDFLFCVREYTFLSYFFILFV
uniref:Uncharacterized protein n=1 Tax=Heterorhabditis bacteriophora TaxID=37862 RepID=A0A1I7WHW0_HETBA